MTVMALPKTWRIIFNGFHAYLNGVTRPPAFFRGGTADVGDWSGFDGCAQALMLDEPSMGLAPMIINDVFSILADLKNQGKTILLVEQNAKKALAVADYAYVLDRGRIVQEGAGQELRDDAAIVQAYLGG